MNPETTIEHGRAQTIGRLLSMTAEVAGVDMMPEADRAQAVQVLRALADTIERAPGSVKGVVLISAEHVVGDREGIQRNAIMVGAQPFIAATHLTIEEHGTEALRACLPHLLLDAITNAAAEVGAQDNG